MIRAGCEYGVILTVLFAPYIFDARSSSGFAYDELASSLSRTSSLFIVEPLNLTLSFTGYEDTLPDVLVEYTERYAFPSSFSARYAFAI